MPEFFFHFRLDWYQVLTNSDNYQRDGRQPAANDAARPLSLTSIRVGQKRARGFRGGVREQADQAGCGEGLHAEAEDALVRHADALAVQRVQELQQ